MNNLKILGWDKKPKTLYRYIKEGDIFAFQIKIDLFGFGRILAKNPLGVSERYLISLKPIRMISLEIKIMIKRLHYL